MPITTAIITGLLGGVLRGLVGYYKNQTIEKMKFNLRYFLLTIGVSAFLPKKVYNISSQPVSFYCNEWPIYNKPR